MPKPQGVIAQWPVLSGTPAGNPATGHVFVYYKSADGKLYTKNSAGVEALVDEDDFAKAPVRTLSSGNVTLSGLQTVSGVALNEGDRVLLWVQTNGAENGIYNASAGAWTRSSDANTIEKLFGAYVYVTEGTWATVQIRTKAKTGDVLGTTPQTWVWTMDNGLNDIPGGVPRLDSNTLLKVAQVPPTPRAVRTMATSNITTLSGLQTVSSVALAEGDRVVLTAQSTAQNNGIYLASTGAWTRTTDADTIEKLKGATVYVTEGALAGVKTRCTAKTGDVLGTTALTWVREVVGTGVFGALPIESGGTGTVSATGARWNLGAPGTVSSWEATVTAGTWYTVTHNLSTQYLSAQFLVGTPSKPIELEWENVAGDDSIRFRSDVTLTDVGVFIVGN